MDQARLEGDRQVQRHPGRGLVLVPLKTKASRRTIALTGLACGALRQQREAQDEAKREAGSDWQDNDLIFSTKHGKPLERQNVSRAHKQALDRAHLPHIRQHDFRHTVATLHLEQGENPKVVQERLGHSSITETLSTYSHVLPSMDRAAADRLNGLFEFRARRKPQIKERV